MKNVLLLDHTNYKSTWHTDFELTDIDQLICYINPRKYFDNKVCFVLRNNNNSELFEYNDSKWNNKSFLKSHLQKCVRRHKKKLAIKSSLELIKIDQNEFIRRLSIIMIEDSDIFSCLPTIIWFMVAISKGYKLTINDVEWLLGCVKVITKCKSKFIYKMLEETDDLKSNDNIYNNCILLRINYGGMKGDMTMLKNTANVIEKYSILKKKVKLQKIKNIKLRLSDTLPVGMDFHVSKKILYDIHDYLKKNKNIYINITNIKKWMWQTRSGINFRLKANKENNTPLKSIHKEVDNICLNYITNYHIN